MAADIAFQSVLNFVTSSKLNFSIYRTPFSAQLSLKKTFAKHFSDRSTNFGNIPIEEKDSLQIKIKQVEDQLKDKTRENNNLKNLNEELYDEMDDLKAKCKTLEDNLKSEKKKAKKARQKAEKKLVEHCEVKVKVEETDDEEVEEVVHQDAVVKSESSGGEVNASQVKTLSILRNDSIDIFPNKMNDIGIQSAHIITKLAETQTQKFKEFNYQCFYCEEMIVNELVLENHRKVCCDKYLDETFKSDLRNYINVREASDLNRRVVTHNNFGFSPVMMPQHSFPWPISFTELDVTCYTCSAKMNFKSELKAHYSEFHPEIVLFWCETCYTNFGSERGLKSHRRNKHGDFS